MGPRSSAIDMGDRKREKGRILQQQLNGVAAAIKGCQSSQRRYSIRQILFNKVNIYK